MRGGEENGDAGDERGEEEEELPQSRQERLMAQKVDEMEDREQAR